MRCLFLSLLLVGVILPAAATAQYLPNGFGCDYSFNIEFDDDPAPGDFASTSPLTLDEHSGVIFSGPAPGQGGAILDESSGFGVSGHSSPNFLAFDRGTYAVGPETFDFFIPAATFWLEAAVRSGDTGQLTLECFDERGASRGSTSVAGTTTLQRLEIQAPGMDRCVFSFTSQTAVVDNLLYYPCDAQPGDGAFPGIEVPSLSGRGRLLLALALAAAGLVALARQSAP